MGHEAEGEGRSTEEREAGVEGTNQGEVREGEGRSREGRFAGEGERQRLGLGQG